VNGGPGESHERTTLAWQRTALALVAGSAVLTRLTFDRLGPLALLSVGVAAPLGLWLLQSRGRDRHEASGAVPTRTGSAAAPLVITLATSTVALVELAALLVR
jgi:uncharacterized membrane protein YidH (DUF202 family)